MAQQTITGNDWLGSLETEDLPFSMYLSFGSLLFERWDSQTFDTGAARKLLSFKSSEGSTISYNGTETNAENGSGTSSGTIVIAGPVAGINLSGRWSDQWSSNDERRFTDLTFTSTNGTATKADDISYRFIESGSEARISTASGSSGQSSERMSLNFSNAQYAFQFETSGSGSWTWSNAAQANTASVFSSTVTKYGFRDFESGTSISMSATIQADEMRNKAMVEVRNVRYATADFSSTTAKYSASFTMQEFDAIPNIGPDDGNDFFSLSANFTLFHQFVMGGDNTVVITASDGVELDAGAGNDRVTGGVGDDTLIAGAGRDTLSGGRGNDTFVLRFRDYDFSSAKNLLPDTISDFRFTATESDSLMLEGFDEVVAFKTLADARKAQSDATVIYESATGRFWYNEDADPALVGVMNFATVRGIPATYWAEA